MISHCYTCGVPIRPDDELCRNCRARLLLNGRRYQIIRQLKATQLSTVYEAVDTVVEGRRCAIKQVEARSKDDLGRMQNEIAILANSGLSFIPTVHDRWSEGLTHYFAMEFIVGQTLDSARVRPWSPADAIEFLQTLLGYLIDMHSVGLIHRDLKPWNIMLATEGRHRGRYVLLDFNIAKNIAEHGTDTLPFIEGGTRGYAPPEQMIGGRTDERSDLYGLAATTYALLYPVSEGNLIPPVPGEFDLAGLPAILDATLRVMLEYNPNQRPQNAREALGLLRGEIAPPHAIVPVVPGEIAPSDETTSAMSATPERFVLGGGRADGVAWLNHSNSTDMLVASALGVYRYNLKTPDSGALVIAPGALRRVKIVAPGDHIAVVGDRVAEVWRLSDAKRRHQLEDYPAISPDELAFAADGASAGALFRGRLLVWRVSDGRLQQFVAPPGSYRVAVGAGYAAVATERGVQLLQASTGAPVRMLNLARAPVSALAFSADGSALAVASGRQISIFPTNSSAPTLTTTCDAAPITLLAFDAKGERVACAAGQRVMLWRLKGSQPLRELETLVTSATDLAFAPDDQLLAAAGDGTIRVYRTRDGSRERSLEAHTTGAYCLACAADGSLVAATNGIATLLHMDHGVLDGQIPIETLPMPPHALAFAPDGRTVAVASAQAIHFWQVPDLAPHGDLAAEIGQSHSLAFADPDRLIVLTARAVQCWILGDRWLLQPGIADLPDYELAALSPDGSTLAIMTGQALQVWPIPGATPQWEQRIEREINHIALARGGTCLAVVADAETQLWNVGDDEPFATLAQGGHRATFAPNGRMLAILRGSQIGLWSVNGDRLAFVRAFEGHTDTVLDAVFCGGARWLLSSGSDGTLRVWACDEATARLADE